LPTLFPYTTLFLNSPKKQGIFRQNLLMNPTVGCMRTRQVTNAHQEFIDDFSASETKGFLKKLHPLFFAFRVMVLQPFLERTKFLLQYLNGFCVFDGCIHL